MDTKDLDIAKPVSPFVDGMFHTLNQKRIAELKAQMIANIELLFSKIEYGANGNALNQIVINQKRDFETLPAPDGRVYNIPKSTELSIRVEPTLMQLKAEIDRVLAGETHKPQPSTEVAEATPAENLDPAFREHWRETAKRMYEAYGQSVNWKAVSGHPMPRFDDVGPRVEGAWCVAAEASFFSTRVT